MAKRVLKYSVVDAFTDTAYTGNPAAVCFLEGEERSDEWLELFAKEVNMPVTSYLTLITNNLDSSNLRFQLRLFNRVGDEVPMCGHATLAAAHAVFTSSFGNYELVEFSTLSGIITARKIPEKKTTETQSVKEQDNFSIELDLPVVKVFNSDGFDFSSVSTILNGAIPVAIRNAEKKYLLIELPSSKDVENYQPDFDKLRDYPASGIIITGRASPDSDIHFYSRFFFPRWGIDEDIVCGSAHCALADYWNKKLGEIDFVAHSANPRGRTIRVRLDKPNQRVVLLSKAVKVMEGSVLV